MRRSLALVALVLAAGSGRTALADPVAALPTQDEPPTRSPAPSSPAEAPAQGRARTLASMDDEASDVDESDHQLSAGRIESLRRERDEIHRGAPITLLVVGSVVGVYGVALTRLQGLGGMGEGSASPKPSSPTGLYVAAGVGFTAAAVGLIWLIDCNHRRSKIEQRIEWLSDRAALVLPSFDPVTKTAELSLLRRF